MADLMKLTYINGGEVWINPEMICGMRLHGKGTLLYVTDPVGDIEVMEDPEKVLNERRAAMEKQP
jgi:uncharacterized protein YlzI (FlbEa/FlbD family)